MFPLQICSFDLYEHKASQNHIIHHLNGQILLKLHYCNNYRDYQIPFLMCHIQINAKAYHSPDYLKFLFALNRDGILQINTFFHLINDLNNLLRGKGLFQSFFYLQCK